MTTPIELNALASATVAPDELRNTVGATINRRIDGLSNEAKQAMISVLGTGAQKIDVTTAREAGTDIKTLYETLKDPTQLQAKGITENIRREFHEKIVKLLPPIFVVAGPPVTEYDIRPSLENMKNALVPQAPQVQPPAGHAAEHPHPEGFWKKTKAASKKTWDTINDLPTAAKVAGAATAGATALGAMSSTVHNTIAQLPVVGSSYSWLTAKAAEALPVVSEKLGFNAAVNALGWHPVIAPVTAGVLAGAAGVWGLGRIKQEFMKTYTGKKEGQEGSAFMAGFKLIGEAVTIPIWGTVRVVGKTLGYGAKSAVTFGTIVKNTARASVDIATKPLKWIVNTAVDTAGNPKRLLATLGGAGVGVMIMPAIFVGASPLVWAGILGYAGNRFMKSAAVKDHWASFALDTSRKDHPAGDVSPAADHAPTAAHRDQAAEPHHALAA